MVDGIRLRRLSDASETSPTPDPLPKDETEQTRPERETLAKVNRQEKGDLGTKDQHTWGNLPGGMTVVAQVAADTRRTIAREVAAAAKRAIASHGSIKLAAALQVLKRELARCHDVLDGQSSEQNYLSIVVLAEMILGEVDWKVLSKDRLEKVRGVLAVGEIQPIVTYNDYNQAFRQLNAIGALAGPEFDVVDCNPAVDG
jgi:hypothetical protein